MTAEMGRLHEFFHTGSSAVVFIVSLCIYIVLDRVSVIYIISCKILQYVCITMTGDTENLIIAVWFLFMKNKFNIKEHDIEVWPACLL